METLDFGLHDILIYEMRNGEGKGRKYLEKKNGKGNILHLHSSSSRRFGDCGCQAALPEVVPDFDARERGLGDDQETRQ